MAVRAEEQRRNGHRHAPAGRRARPVPGGRAVLGGFLVAASVVGLFWASTSDQTPARLYVVTAHAVAPGTRLAASDLTRRPLDLTPELAQRAFGDVSSLEGATVVAPLGPGELVQASAVVAKPSGPASREVSFAVPGPTLGPGLEVGERIDVVATFGAGGDAFSTVVLRQALVVNLDRGRGDDRDATVTVAIDDVSDAVALAHASQEGKLTVVRATGAPPVAPHTPVFRAPNQGPATGARS